MTRRPGKKARRLPPRKSGKLAKRTKARRRDPLDDQIVAGARSLDLTIEKAWLPAVRGHLDVILRHGAFVAEFQLPDDAEPALVFRA